MVTNFTSNSLLLLLWNANGVMQHFAELEYTLHDKRIDIALITETHLKSYTRFYIHGYTVYRADHPSDRSHGGTAIVIKSSLKHDHILTNQSTNFLQACAVAVYFGQ